MLLAIILLSACTDNDDNPSGTPQPPAVDVGPSFTEKTVDVSRDGNAYGQVAIRFYSDMPSVPYISVADFHRVMTGGEMMKVSRQGSLYQLTTRDGAATVDVKDDYLFSTSYGGFVNLMWLLDHSLPPNAMHDGSKYLKLVKMEHPSMFKPVNGVRLDFKKYQINLHDDGTTVYCPFATLADMYSDCNFHYAACHDDMVLVSTKLDTYTMNIINPEYAAKPYQKAEVAADMANYRYQELCFVFDNLFGYPGRTIMEQNGMGEKGFDATLESVENGPVVKRLLQSANNMDFAWGRMALQYLLYDGGHTSIHAMAGMPENVRDDYEKRMVAAASNYPEAVSLYNKWTEWRNEYYDAKSQLAALCSQAYGGAIYKANSDKTLGVIVMESFGNQDNDAWDRYYASDKGDSNWQELMTNYKNDDFIAFLCALGQAKADGVKNLVLDISQNSGGSDDIVTADVALLRKNRRVEYWSQDVLEGKNNIATYVVDCNFDGVFDERDDTHPKFDCSGMNVAVLASKVSFSCGNIFPCVMRDYGFPIMGERSGGGPCCIQVMLTADGQHYMVSTYRDRATTKDFLGIDTGIAPNDGYAFGYADFYNLDFLGNKMNEYYRR